MGRREGVGWARYEMDVRHSPCLFSTRLSLFYKDARLVPSSPRLLSPRPPHKSECPPPSLMIGRPLPSVALALSYPSPTSLVPPQGWTHTSPSTVSSTTGRSLSNASTVHHRLRETTGPAQRSPDRRPHPSTTMLIVQRRHHPCPDTTKPHTRPTDPHSLVQSPSLIFTSWRSPRTCVPRSKSSRNASLQPLNNSAGNRLTPASELGLPSLFPS